MGSLAGGAASAQQPRPALDARLTGRFTDPRVGESSAVIRGVANPAILWTLNDSGNPAVLFAVDTTGRVRAAIRLAGATNVDWEAISVGPCGRTPGPCLYVGDVGDNFSRRPSVTLYRLPEPRLAPNPPAAVEVQDSLVVRYATGAQDIEAMVVPPDGTVMLFGKGWHGRPAVFAIPKSAWTGGRYLAAPIDTLPIDTGALRGALVTDAALSPDGRWLAVRTYRDIYFFRRQGSGLGYLRRVAFVCNVGRREPQGEGLAFWSARTLVLTSERLFGADGTILLVRCDGL